MKKRLPAIMLAFALCLGLAVPAFASAGRRQRSLHFQAPQETPERQALDLSYKKLDYIGSGKTTVGYPHPAQSSQINYPALPTPKGVNLVVTGLGEEESIRIWAYSKWGDRGEYYQRFFGSEDGQSRGGPRALAATYDNPSGASIAYSCLAEDLGFNVTRDEDGSITLSADHLFELFGPDSIVDLSASEAGDLGGFNIARLLLASEGGSAPAFSDTPSWCSAEAQWAVEQGITNGAGSATLFAPALECTHEQILTFLWRASGKPAAAQEAPITAASYYQDAINWAYEKDFINDSFHLSAPCTRVQAVWYIWKALGEPQAARAASFSDLEPNYPYLPAVSWAVEKEVTKGYGSDSTFAPDKVCSRGEIACFLYRAYN